MRPYLRYIKIGSFGVFFNKTVGPFKPGLNIVYGSNEAGKSTLNAFVGGVLFGWDHARGTRNTYKPENAERVGSLFFETEEGEKVLYRARNVDGLQGDVNLVADIDQETHQTIFSLTADQLNSLAYPENMTAKLLTAGSGTIESPAHVREILEKRITEYSSRASGLEHSLANLVEQQEELSQKMAAVSKEMSLYKEKDKEYHDVTSFRKKLQSSLECLNQDIEKLVVVRTEIKKYDDEILRNNEEIASLTTEIELLDNLYQWQKSQSDNPTRILGCTQEQDLRDLVDSLAAEEAKHESLVDLAQEDFSASELAYKALLNKEERQPKENSQSSSFSNKIIVLPILFLLIGVSLFLFGVMNTQSLLTVGGLLLGLVAILLASFITISARKVRNSVASDIAHQKQNLYDSLMENKTKLEYHKEAREQFRSNISAQFDGIGLEDTGGSLSRARRLLDESRVERLKNTTYQQQREELSFRLNVLEDAHEQALVYREKLFDGVGLGHCSLLEEVDVEISQKAKDREELLSESEKTNSRYGELKQELSHALTRDDFDVLKLEKEQVKTRINESANDYARLLLAKKMLVEAIKSWEHESQPEVYRMASRLLSIMTQGKWVQIAMTDKGTLQVFDEVKTARGPKHLSLGTCQQLYLALRIALLVSADNVGQAIPVFADDILVNFDAKRRSGAAQALRELAKTRQVIILTCHKEVVKDLKNAVPSAHTVQL